MINFHRVENLANINVVCDKTETKAKHWCTRRQERQHKKQEVNVVETQGEETFEKHERQFTN